MNRRKDRMKFTFELTEQEQDLGKAIISSFILQKCRLRQKNK